MRNDHKSTSQHLTLSLQLSWMAETPASDVQRIRRGKIYGLALCKNYYPMALLHKRRRHSRLLISCTARDGTIYTFTPRKKDRRK
jgi:hypothetical protein